MTTQKKDAILGSLQYVVAAALLVFAIGMAASCGKRSWPAPVIPVLTETQIPAGAWVEKTGPTNSMGDYVPPGSTIVLRKYNYGEPLKKGTVVVFDRGDYPRVLHVIADEKDNSYYLSGYNNKQSDGWFDRSKVSAVLVAIVRGPAK